MNESSQKDLGIPRATENRCAIRHPAWCDHGRCTANPASQADGYRGGQGGEHRSTPIPLNLTGAFPLPAHAGAAYLSESVAPWPCSTYLRIQVGDAEVSMPVEYAGPVLSALRMLVAADEVGEGDAR